VGFFRQKTLATLLLAGTLVSVSMPAAAFDPLGFIVNEVMNYILDHANDPVRPEGYEISYPVSNRGIPPESKPGRLEPTTNGNQIEINGDDYELAFNSRIRDEGNRIVHTGMIQQKKRIRYTLNNQNQVDRIWLLAPNEK
jgi:hypothetical protein